MPRPESLRGVWPFLFSAWDVIIQLLRLCLTHSGEQAPCPTFCFAQRGVTDVRPRRGLRGVQRPAPLETACLVMTMLKEGTLEVDFKK